MSTATRTLDDILSDLSAAMAAKDEADAAASDVGRRVEALKVEARAVMDREGIDRCAGAGLSVTVGNVWAVSVPPEQWEAFKAWAVESGNSHVLHRAISTQKFMELVDGGLAPPEYVKIESFKRLNTRRVGGA